ncbi:VWA domain-containing protein [Streptomyces sp. MBT65]|uniref:vWA domain-containing protein n=1 Tax=Streptomyces sp. MBT65 TaxID=1488395 RepID=UPI00190C65D6|nr:VWA domain-containing protein [Streptomyces sp. MBT65]MBK3572941.1 VWA domain-containing protein [Streptomyces sp. MBT65]
MTPTGPLLPAVDRAAFATALAARLREHGVPVGPTAARDFVLALAAAPPRTRTSLYWTARVTLVRDRPELARFDEVFDAVFGQSVLALDPNARRNGHGGAGGAHDSGGTDAHGRDPVGGSGLPWVTLPPAVDTADHRADRALTVPERLPSDLAGAVDTPFGELAPDQAELLGRWLEERLRAWPVRRTRRLTVRTGGHRVAVRETVAQARRTGWEPVRLVRAGPLDRPRRVVVLCDVSRSMQAQAVAYLYLMRALALTTRAEVFAFATSLTRLTPALAHHSAQEALDEATARVTDRFGGTRIAHSLGTLLASHHGGSLRGAVVLIASDGWDGDPAHQLATVMARLRRRAHTVIWLNPRAAAPGFRPRTTTMAAALPYVDLLLPADSFGALLRVPDEIARLGRPRGARLPGPVGTARPATTGPQHNNHALNSTTSHESPAETAPQ